MLLTQQSSSRGRSDHVFSFSWAMNLQFDASSNADPYPPCIAAMHQASVESAAALYCARVRAIIIVPDAAWKFERLSVLFATGVEGVCLRLALEDACQLSNAGSQTGGRWPQKQSQGRNNPNASHLWIPWRPGLSHCRQGLRGPRSASSTIISFCILPPLLEITSGPLLPTTPRSFHASICLPCTRHLLSTAWKPGSNAIGIAAPGLCLCASPSTPLHRHHSDHTHFSSDHKRADIDNLKLCCNRRYTLPQPPAYPPLGERHPQKQHPVDVGPHIQPGNCIARSALLRCAEVSLRSTRRAHGHAGCHLPPTPGA